MQVRFRLAEILEELRDTERGRIKTISKATGLERHQVSALLRNEVQYLSLNTLGAICDYLINTHHIHPLELPGILFALEPENFWAFLSERQQLVMSFGVRRELQDTGMLWIPAADSFLQGMLLHELYGGEKQAHEPDSTELAPSEIGPQFEQYMVRTFTNPPNQSQKNRDAEFQLMKQEAMQAYARFHAITGNKALVSLGSVKSNGLCELTVSQAFSASPWISEDEITFPEQRSCPFFFSYRAKDVNIPSCQAGTRLAKNMSGQKLPTQEPGLYFERELNKWDGIPTHKSREPALVFYTFRPPLGIAEVVMGGFSTVGTFLLAQHFRKIVREIWPPTFVSPALEVGVFIVDFQLKTQAKADVTTDLHHDLSSSIREVDKLEIIPLPAEVLAHRLAKFPT